MRTGIFTLLIAIFSSFTALVMAMNAASADEVIGWMEIKPADRQIGVSARAYSPDASSIEYVLQIERLGRSGKSATKQHGKAEVAPGKIAELSTASVNVGSGDRLAILLTISSGGRIVSTSALHVGEH
jgi:hypothetical protein